jgi:hypothetical protein
MRSLTVVTLFAFAASPALAADKDEDKAKEAAVAFLKAVKAKDADAVLKTAELPFLTMVDGSPMVFEKAADLKADLKAKLDTIKDADKVPTEIERIAPFADLKDKIKDEDRRKAVEKVMGAGGGFVAFVKTADDKTVVILVRLKDGKAKVVGFGQH